jgi:hypothetical protein
MPAITARDGTDSTHRAGPYSGLPNKLVAAFPKRPDRLSSVTSLELGVMIHRCRKKKRRNDS